MIKGLKDFCHLSKNLYNYANFILRQEFIANKSIPKEYDLSKTLANDNQIDYRALPVIINGKGIKSVNQFYNKLKANYQAKAKSDTSG